MSQSSPQTSGPTLVTYAYADGIATLTLHNPPANAYSYEMFRQLDDAVLRARMDTSVHVIVITGHGEKVFCAGADIAMLRAATPEFKYYFCLHANETLLRLEHTPKLVIAAINGHCVGGGLEIAMACDLRIARRNAGKLGLPEVALGVLPGTGGTQRLSRLVGRAKAMELMVKGSTFTCEAARDMGLITDICDVSAADFPAAVTAYARDYCPPGKAAGAVGHIKRAVQTGSDLSMEAGLALERELQQRLFAAPDAKEGLAAYTEKRAPQFRG
ncbi:MAG: enoyl-CoA hydratase/isomerase family protein [Myxococcales bacterium]|nr:enoyl-CoA hydratase/isomerase family protein [Myxococcales bacterium]